MKQLTIGILGAGKMGEALIAGLQKKTNHKIIASAKSTNTAKEIEKKYKIKTFTDNAKLATESDVVILCVKPHQAKSICEEIQKSLSKKNLLITICTAVSTSQSKSWTKGKAPIIRAMPNTPCLINAGMTVLCAGEGVNAQQLEIAKGIFESVGKTEIVEESLFDGVTGLSGCGPAYMYMIIESLSEAGVKVGLSRKTAILLAAQTMLGSAKMVLDRGVHPAALKDEVTTPAGCTIDGLMALEDGKLRMTLIKAVVAATKRSSKLS